MSATYQTKSGLYIPGAAGVTCSMCGEVIPGPAFASHAEECYRANEGEIQREAAQQLEPVLDHDTEFQQYVKQNGRRT